MIVNFINIVNIFFLYMLNLVEIKFGIGVSSLLFGSTVVEAEDLFGKPDDIDLLDEFEDNKATIYHYWEKGFSLFFDENNSNLFSNVEIDCKEALLWNEKIFMMDETQLIKLFKMKGYYQFESELHDWGEKRVSFDKASVDFYFEKNKLVSLNYGIIQHFSTILNSN